MKVFVLFLIAIFSVWLFHGALLIKVSKLELSVKAEKKILDDLQKEREKKEIEYDSMMDLERIGNEMRAKKQMIISNDIKFFRIDE